MATIKTTTKKFKDGVAVGGDNPTIAWESTGHLAVRLTDELGQVPLPGRTATVTIPGEGKVELVADDDGVIRHPDVPFLDYELDLGDAKVHVPAVANPDDLHERHAPGVAVGFANLLVRDAAGDPIADVLLSVRGPDGAPATLRLDGDGAIASDAPLPPGDYELSCARGRATIQLPARRTALAVVTLEEPS